MKILLTDQIAAETEPHLPPDIEVVHVDEMGNLDGEGGDVELFFRWWSPGYSIDQVVVRTPALRWIHTPSAGVDHILTPTVRALNLTITNGAGVHDIPVAEFTLARIFEHAKRLARLRLEQAQRHWIADLPRNLDIQEVNTSTLLIIGMGHIGQAIATRAAACGMRVWGSRRTPQPMTGVEHMVGADAWRDLLPEANYIVLTLPLTPETHHIIDAATLRAMRPDAYLINVARGDLIDETALLTALQQGWIAGAALDVLSGEPLPSDSPLWMLDNLFISPHCAWLSPHMRQRSVALFLDNLTRYRTGAALRNVVDQDSGY